jgi:A/G-specific adenine glycosylase
MTQKRPKTKPRTPVTSGRARSARERPDAPRAARDFRTGAGRAAFQRRLHHFFEHNQRDMPWRNDREPYRIWVSEVMLQQTRSETVRSYYERWLQRFPDLKALADASLDDVLKVWEGLGYYSRARNLHRAALVICERHDGRIPNQLAELRALPGIGDYTAGAIVSIAFGQPAPAVDGNVKRVLCRLLDKPVLTMRQFQDTAAGLVSGSRPGDFNQAFMELGSTICTPRSPKCDRCPVSEFCRSRVNGTQLERPATKPGSPLPLRVFQTVLLRDRAGRVLLRQRDANGLLAGLWEFPTAEQLTDFPVDVLDQIASVAHTFSHFRARYDVYRARLRGKAKAPQGAALRWVEPDDLANYALPRAQRRIAGYLGD